MKKFKYIGNHPDGVDVPALGLVNVTPGTLVEVDDPSLSESMEHQTDAWQHIPDPVRSRAAKKAADNRDDSKGDD